jgi:hypothetical protein
MKGVAALEDQVIAHLQSQSGKRETIEVVGFGDRRVHGKVDEGGELDHRHTAASAPRNEEGALVACQTLILRWRQDGAAWRDVEDPAQGLSGRERARREGGVDGKATRDDGVVALMQVTRVLPEPDYLRQLSIKGNVSSAGSAIAAADALMDAVNAKAGKDSGEQQRTKHLVLDAQEAPGLLTRAVLNEFRNKHRASISRMEYLGIWLVGPSPNLVFRLDVG